MALEKQHSTSLRLGQRDPETGKVFTGLLEDHLTPEQRRRLEVLPREEQRREFLLEIDRNDPTIGALGEHIGHIFDGPEGQALKRRVIDGLSSVQKAHYDSLSGDEANWYLSNILFDGMPNAANSSSPYFPGGKVQGSQQAPSAGGSLLEKILGISVFAGGVVLFATWTNRRNRVAREEGYRQERPRPRRKPRAAWRVGIDRLLAVLSVVFFVVMLVKLQVDTPSRHRDPIWTTVVFLLVLLILLWILRFALEWAILWIWNGFKGKE